MNDTHKTEVAKKAYLVVGVLVLLGLVVISGASAVKAQEGKLSFWEAAGKAFGLALAEKAEAPQIPEEYVAPTADVGFGAAGDTFQTLKQNSVIGVTTTESLPDTPSTTLDRGSLLNPTVANGGRQRLITRLRLFVASSTATWLGGPLIMDFNTSPQFASSSLPIYSSTFTTSTNPVVISTSTPNGASPGAWQMIWQPGEYLHCTFNRAISSTYSLCEVDYVIVQ